MQPLSCNTFKKVRFDTARLVYDGEKPAAPDFDSVRARADAAFAELDAEMGGFDDMNPAAQARNARKEAGLKAAAAIDDLNALEAQPAFSATHPGEPAATGPAKGPGERMQMQVLPKLPEGFDPDKAASRIPDTVRGEAPIKDMSLARSAAAARATLQLTFAVYEAIYGVKTDRISVSISTVGVDQTFEKLPKGGSAVTFRMSQQVKRDLIDQFVEQINSDQLAQR